MPSSCGFVHFVSILLMSLLRVLIIKSHFLYYLFPQAGKLAVDRGWAINVGE